MARSPRRGALAFVAALLLTLAFATQASAATYTVNTTDDTSDAGTGDGVCADGAAKCSLRAAIEESNDNETADVITLPAGRYVFGAQSASYLVDGDLTINGAGAPDTIIDSDGRDSAFFVTPESSLTGSGFTVTGGKPCDCNGEGGAFFVLGSTLDLTDVRLTRNQVVDGGGGAVVGIGAAMKFTRVRMDHNSSWFAGGAVAALFSELEIVDSVIEANSTQGDGGGLFVAGLENRECGPEGLAAAAGASLSDPSEEPGRLYISGTTINDNVAGARGGAIANSPVEGGIIALLNADESSGEPEQTIVNSTLSGNIAGVQQGCSDGCDLPAVRLAGAIYQDAGDGSLDLVNDTIAENSVVKTFEEEGNDPFNNGGNIAAVGQVSLRNTIVADGTARGEHNNCVSFHEGNRFTSLGHNLETKGNTDHISDCNLTEASDKPNTDPKLGPLADNGGLTPTHALRDGSPAIDAVPTPRVRRSTSAAATAPPAGGRPVRRATSAPTEAYSLADLSVEAKGASATATVGQPLTYTLVVRNSGPDKVNGVTLTDALPAGVELVSADGCIGKRHLCARDARTR